jgi:hypothetical protein
MNRKKLHKAYEKLSDLQNKLSDIKALDKKEQEKLNDHISIAYDVQNDIKHLLTFENDNTFGWIGLAVGSIIVTGLLTFMFTSTCIGR